MKRMIDQELFDEKVSAAQVEALLASGDVEEIHADEIVENMTGYAWQDVDTRFSLIYCGVVKNGNKLTFAVFGKINGDDVAGSNNTYIGKFNIPTSIGQSLIPTLVGSTNILDIKNVHLYSNIIKSSKEISVYVEKPNNNQLAIVQFGITDASLTAGTDYFFRYECTFLLSDNLAVE